MKKYYSKKSPKAKIIKFVVIFILYTAYMYWLQIDKESMLISVLISWPLMLILGIYGIIHAAQNKPTLTINDEGIVDTSSLIGIGKLDWQEIKNVEIRGLMFMKFLCFDLKDENTVLLRANFMKRFILKNHKKKLRTICSIPETFLNKV